MICLPSLRRVWVKRRQQSSSPVMIFFAPSSIFAECIQTRCRSWKNLIVPYAGWRKKGKRERLR
jgi:hypothetical protein